VTMTLRQVGGALGVALLGSLSSAAYTHRLDTAGLPPVAAHAARGTVNGAVAVAGALHDPALLTSAQAAYVHAMTVVLLVCAAAALAGGVAAALFLPARAHTGPDSGESTHELARVA